MTQTRRRPDASGGPPRPRGRGRLPGMHSAAVQRTAGAPVLQALHDISGLAASAQRGMRGALAVPMMVAGRPIGVLGVWTYAVRHFTEEEVQLLAVFAANIAPAFEASRLAAQQARQAESLRSLHDVAVAVTSIHERGAIAGMAAEKACEMVGGDGADICWWDDEADLLVSLSSHREV